MSGFLYGFSAKSHGRRVHGLTKPPFATPIVQVGDVGEHVIDPVFRKSRT